MTHLYCCICDSPLVPHSSKRKKSKSKSTFNSVSNKKPLIVVAAKCGDLFHRICLQQYCLSSENGKESRNLDPVECPACGKAIRLSHTRVIDVITHEGYGDRFTKDIELLEMMTQELEEQYHYRIIERENIKQAINELAPYINFLENHIEAFQTAVYTHYFLTDTKQAISETKAALTVVQEYNITLVRTLLTILKEYSPTVISEKEILPTELIPAIELIKDDKTVLQKLVDVVAPKPYGLSPNRLTLTAEILTFVRKTSLCDRLEKFHEELKKQVSLQKQATRPKSVIFNRYLSLSKE